MLLAERGPDHDTRPDAGTPATLTRAEVQARSELGRHLRGSIFPADAALVLAARWRSTRRRR